MSTFYWMICVETQALSLHGLARYKRFHASPLSGDCRLVDHAGHSEQLHTEVQIRSRDGASHSVAITSPFYISYVCAFNGLAGSYSSMLLVSL